MREARSPNPFVVASVFGTRAALVVFLAGPVQLSGRWLASGIVSWSTVSIVNPLEDYVWYASSLLAGVLAGGLVLAVYERRRRVTSEPSMSGAETGADVPAARLVAPIVVACTCLWFVHAAVFDLWIPIANTIDPQPLTPAGMRFDAFHEGERLAFGPAFAHLSSPFSGTFFIHGFGVDALPDVLGRSLLPSLDHIVAMRLFVVIELLLTALASVWAVLEVIRARAPDGNRGLLAIALLLYLVLSRTVYQFMLIALIELALVVRICRLRDAPESVIARHAFVTGLLLPIGAFYSYSGLITSLVVVAAAVVFDARLRVGRSGLALLAGVATGAIAIVASVGPRQTTAESSCTKNPIDITLMPWASSGMILRSGETGGRSLPRPSIRGIE